MRRIHSQRFALAAGILAATIGANSCRREAGPSAEQQAAAQRAADSARAAEAAAARVRAAITPVIHFDFDRSAIRPDARPILDSKVSTLREDPSLRIRIAGHCDIRGTVEYNQALGRRRANAAKQYLVRAGIDGSRIEVVSFGETRPVNPGTTREAHAENRRAEFETL